MYDPHRFVKKSASSPGQSGPLSGYAQVLAWKSECYNSTWWEVVFPRHAYVIQDRDTWPLGGQQLNAVRVLLDTCQQLEPGHLESQVKSAYAREE